MKNRPGFRVILFLLFGVCVSQNIFSDEIPLESIESALAVTYRIEDTNESTKQTEKGTGFLIHPSGLLLTTNHGIKSAKKIKAIRDDGFSFPCDLIVRVPQCDISILKSKEPLNLTYAALKSSENLKKNEQLFSPSNLRGFNLYLLRGYFSKREPNRTEELYVKNALILDMPCESGASGAPVFDRNAEVISMIYGSFSGRIPMASTIPVEEFLPEIKRFFDFSALSGVEPEFELERNENGEFLVKHVDPNSGTAENGLNPGDRVLRIGPWNLETENDPWISLLVYSLEHREDDIRLTLLKKNEKGSEAEEIINVPWKKSVFEPDFPNPDKFKEGCRIEVFSGKDEQPKISAWTKNPNMLRLSRNDKITIKGYIHLPKTGRYMFSMKFPGTGVLSVGEKYTLEKNNDHAGMSTARAGFFEAGVHRFEWNFNLNANTDGPFLQVSNPQGETLPDPWFCDDTTKTH